MELARPKQFTVATDVQVYFCHLQSPWQRGTNENTYRLLRQYFPKRRSLARMRQQHCNLIAHKLNQRPRKRYGYKTPIERLDELLGVLRLGC